MVKTIHRYEYWVKEKSKKEFEKDFFKLMNNSVFGKIMENVRYHRDIKLVTSDKRRNWLVSEPNYHSHINLSDHLMAIEMKKTFVKIIKPLYLGMSILDISKTVMNEFWYDYIRPNYGDRQNCAIQILIALLLTSKSKIFLM